MSRGIWYAVGAYGVWGLMPIYWKWLGTVPALQVISHRIVWSCVFLALLVAIRREFGAFRRTAFAPRTFKLYLLAAVMIGINWLLFIWAVQAGHIVDTSLGYFINPLLSIVVGVLVLRERLRPAQWLAIAFATAGVLYLTFAFGAIPWIALVLACSFAVYGFLKKTAPLSSIHGLALETGALLLPAVLFLGMVEARGEGALGHAGLQTNALLLGAGIVTTVPLLLFASAARRLPLAWLGILQYLAPTLQFLLGVLVYGEAMTRSRLTGFAFVWLGLIIFAAEGFWVSRRRMALLTQEN
jgi:chloramphenicol-sensitive protein RarD